MNKNPSYKRGWATTPKAINVEEEHHEKRDIGIFLISSYAPIGNAPDDEWDSYFEQLTRCISRMSPNDILLIDTDTNSSMGFSLDKEDPLGVFHMLMIQGDVFVCTWQSAISLLWLHALKRKSMPHGFIRDVRKSIKSIILSSIEKCRIEFQTLALLLLSSW